MWFGIMFLISVSSWAPYGMGFTTHSSEEECYNHFLKGYGIEDKLNDQPPTNMFHSRYQVRSYWHKDLGKLFVSCMHAENLPIQK